MKTNNKLIVVIVPVMNKGARIKQDGHTFHLNEHEEAIVHILKVYINYNKNIGLFSKSK
jgi:hypothetical protein